MSAESKKAHNFIQSLIEDAIAKGEHTGKVVTRFPPEPNGYLHVGHAKSICLNFGIAQTFGGECNLRFDDTNPEKESQEYIDAIKQDVEWLGYEWADDVRYASDYFDQLYAFAEELIEKGKAYVCALNAEQMAEYRGSLKEPGKNSPYRDRPVEESLQLFRDMRDGKFQNGELVLRAKIDMASPNINLRDPILYRIRYADHHQTGSKWCIYPMYDFTHPISDALEGITHSLCTLEFEDHRPLYDWVLDNITVPCHPRQIEFARLNLNYTITSKRKLKRLVDEHVVDGWNDPRMPTISGMRRRGYTPESIRSFCDMIGVNKAGGTVDVGMLEYAIREDLNDRAPRAMCVMRPLKVTLTNYPADQTETLTLPVHPQKPEMGERDVTWSQTLYIDREDFEVEPPRKWKRLAPEQAVRLRGGYVMTCKEIVRDNNGEIVELKCEYDPNTLGVNPEGYKPNGVIHWVSASDSVETDINLYDRLFNHESPDSDKEGDFLDHLNPESLVVLKGARVEKSLAEPRTDLPYQFEREGYFFCDQELTAKAGKPVFNRTVTLRDSWGKGGK
ncbi:MAG: glutamine--tRNA ligase/YqeY domain fusion protein [Marinobacter sp.]|uniref:glutamine--tRNA ligase/YqeY domain fusion protein n=1 Tax=Marinobacter sp. TaxID=50741 RepID=UPI0029C5C711|nr:glutamine--tRNA ligase/YqeY domain fusion protein [Marinobacter sp.]MDX5335782.1 glutamine--tRNA ligase/YqeY domain fusion protein [Marinobacter sp.]MDX5386789.1 glutamine--tRNA ligase/YqeY domain fusion protein [Marinobacter sp.]MDX5440744.1 glutamine--tRNA ligase/YqeY domain fusion protein [Alteromonadaceae bacterium]MDX5472196.1 glutamine--tRNA ligase/YqeY domain fusion protein [Marinobacter sp.]